MTATPGRKSVNTERAAHMLDIPTRSVRRLINVGKLRAVRLGKYWVIPIEEIDRLLASQDNDEAVSG